MYVKDERRHLNGEPASSSASIALEQAVSKLIQNVLLIPAKEGGTTEKISLQNKTCLYIQKYF